MKKAKKKKAIVYARISTSLQDATSQVDLLIKRAKGEGYRIVKTYSEEKSGYSSIDDREEITSLKKYVQDRKNNISVIFFSEISRIGRNATDIHNFIQACTDAGVCVRILDPHIETLKTDKETGKLYEEPMSKLVVTVLSALADMEGKMIRERLTRGKSHAVLINKKWQGGRPPFAFTIDNEISYKLAPHPVNADIVREMYKMYDKKLSTVSIAAWLVKKGVKTRYGNDYWHEESIRGLLTNRLHIGERTYKGKRIDCPEIVDRELFERVNKRISNMPNQNKKRKFNYLIDSKIIKCPVCGEHFNYVNSRTNSSARCRRYQYAQRIEGYTCANYGIGISKLYNLIFEVMKDARVTEYISSDVPTAKIESVIEKITLGVNRLEQEIKQLHVGDKRLDDNFYSGKSRLTVERFNELLDINEEKRKVLRVEKQEYIDRLESLKFTDSSTNWNKYTMDNKDGITKSISEIVEEITMYPLTDYSGSPIKGLTKKLNFVEIKFKDSLTRKLTLYAIVSQYSKKFLLFKETSAFKYNKDTRYLTFLGDTMVGDLEDYKEYWDFNQEIIAK